MKRKSTLVVLSLLFSLQTFSQNPNWEWAKSAGDSADERGNSIIADTHGNIYVTGYFYSDSISFGSTVLFNAAPDSIAPDSIFMRSNIFTVKYDSLGNVLWAKGAGGTLWDYGESISADNYGNIYITGYFSSDSITFGNTVLTNPGMFVVKYDSSGNVLWAKCAVGNQNQGHGITTDAVGNVYVTGVYHNSATTFGSIVLTCSGNSKMFVVKYDSSGNVLWAKCAGGNYNVYGTKTSTDFIGNIYVTGYFGGPSITFGSTVLMWEGSNDVFIAKYDSSGNVLWAKSAGGTCLDYVNGIVTDMNGNVFITGQYNSPSITIGSTVLTNLSGNCGITCNRCMDIFLFKYDSSGNSVWAKTIGEIANDMAYGITTDATGNIFITGWFQMDSVTFGSVILNNPGMFIVKYDSSGNVSWALSTPGSIGYGITSDVGGNLYVTGTIYGDSAFFGTTVLTNAGGEDIFTAKLSALNSGIEMPSITDENVIVIFPNPANNSFTIKNISAKGKSLLQIISPIGEIVYTERLFGKNEQIVNANFAKGIYFVRVSDEEKNVVRKLVVE